ncbi:MAG: hypothetical protein JNL84_07390 [Candidatus Accumulibacter sp.]|nr:hypothetical protein [Accumulibacter sp.]
MAQNFVPKYIGIHSADAERVSLVYQDQELKVSYIDWQEQPETVVLGEVFAFKWQERDLDSAPRDVTTFQVIESTWLRENRGRTTINRPKLTVRCRRPAA